MDSSTKQIEGVICFPDLVRTEGCFDSCKTGVPDQEDIHVPTLSSVNTVMREYNRNHTDLFVKVPGGMIEAKRWYSDNTWAWEHVRQELFILRNHLPADSLIKELGIPSKIIEGYFRFCCPVCHEFNTGVNPKTNLARCFDCRKNYNTIDLVMLVKGSNFIQSVKFLQRFDDSKEESVLPNPHPIERPSSAQPVSIGEIFKPIFTT